MNKFPFSIHYWFWHHFVTINQSMQFVPIVRVVYISKKLINLSTTDKIHSKCIVIDGSVVNGVRQPILYSFIWYKPPGYKKFCQLEILLFKKINNSVSNTITFYLEDADYQKVKFNGDTLTFTLQLLKV